MLCIPPSTIPEPERAGPRGAEAAAAPEQCPGREIKPDRVITGEFGGELEKSYVLLPFQVPAGTTAIRVKYCHDQPDLAPPGVPNRHTLDLGLYGPRAEFRGWGGSSHPDVTVSAEGFSTEEQYLADPRVDPPGKTTRAFRPGPIVPGRWAVELGVAAIAGQELGDSDGKVAWRVEIALASDPAFADEPYRPTRVRRAARTQRAGLVRRRPARARRALGVRRRHDDRAAGLRLPPARRGRRRARLHHAVRLRERQRLGRGRPLPGQASRQAHRAQRGGDHLPRPREQPQHRGGRGLPRGSDLRAPRGREPRPGPGAAARPRAVRRRAREGRLHADQPPDDLPLRRAALRPALPRLLVGVQRRRDPLREGRRNRDRHRAGGAQDRARVGPEPVHRDRARVLRARACGGPPHRRRGRQRLPPRRAARAPARWTA